MANTSSARKAQKASLKKKVFNVRRTRVMKSSVKDITTAIAGKKKDEAVKLLPSVYKALDKAAKRGVIKPNTASRKKSRLMAAIKAL
jgi:small subunit ribosomal protein S20